MDKQTDEFAGLPMAEWATVPVSVIHPQSVPFGPLPIRFITKTAASVVGVEG